MTEVDRLYKYFKPSRYELSLTPSIKNMTFSGTVSIIGRIAAGQKRLRLHAKDLNISDVAVDAMARSFRIDTDNDELVINLQQNDKGTVRVSIAFDSDITKPMHGLYPCFARNGDVILATQFESHHAREVFPCIDEPEAKAVFSLSLITPSDMVVLANTNPIQSLRGQELTTTLFDDTPLMSTYLLAFVIGNMHAVEAKTKNGTDVRVWASHDHTDETLSFALNTAVRATEFFNDYFDTAYPLEKCDHVALPDFSSGAMENWGLITYREVALLVDPEKTSTSAKEYAATVIAHEISHQWFGNLVTMKWWDDLWLNESFATLMEYMAVDALYPEWNVMLSFTSQEALSAFWRDSIPGVQAVKCNVDHPDQISTLFDPSIVYAKGARLLLMAHNFVGKAAFKKGLRLYFERFAYQNTHGNDLWQALEDASKKPVKKFMNAWIEKPGFPILSVKQSNNTLSLAQKRFSNNQSISDDSLWPIPLSIRPKQPEDSVLNKVSSTYKLSIDRYVRLNSEGAHVSVRYEDPEHREYLKKLIAGGSVPPAERLLMLNDSLMQARAGYGSIVETMELLEAYKDESEDTVWSVMSLCTGDARMLAEADKEFESRMKRFVWQLVEHKYHELGWSKQDGEPLKVTKLRGIILGLAVYSENPDVLAAAIEEYRRYESLASMPADTRYIILAAAVKHGDATIFDELLMEYPQINNAELQQDVCSALTSVRNVKSAERILGKLKHDSFVRLQDFDRWIVYLLRNRKTRATTWRWFTANWLWIEQNFSSDKSYDYYPRYAGGVFSTQAWLDKYIAFFEPLKSEVSLKRNIELGIEDISTRIRWRERDERTLQAWLEQRENSQT